MPAAPAQGAGIGPQLCCLQTRMSPNDMRVLHMYSGSVTEREKGRHRLILTEGQRENREALLEFLGLDEEDTTPAKSGERKAVTVHVTVDEFTELSYLAERNGFRGVSALLVAAARSLLGNYEPPRLKKRRSVRKRR